MFNVIAGCAYISKLYMMVSTPNAPECLFERIEKEAQDTCLYKRIFLDYTYGIGKIYTTEEIKPNNHHHLSENTTLSMLL